LEASQRQGKEADVEKMRPDLTDISLQGDSDLASERGRISSGDAANSPLIISMAGKRFGKIIAVRDVSIAVGSGEILALLGPNGAGKTTLVNCVLGLYRLTSGTATIKGFDIMRQQDQVYHHVGICPQHEILWPDLTCEEHLLFYARLKGIDAHDEKAVVQQCLKQVELADEATKLSKKLSGGQKRRLAIAIALVARPAVVFLDEPTTGLDPNVKRSLWKVIKKVKEMHEMCIVLTTHSMSEPPSSLFLNHI
jgi:ABC-type multidrug transport system ATPase subunit